MRSYLLFLFNYLLSTIKNEAMIAGNFIVKMQKAFLNTMKKISPENSLPLPRNRQKLK